jgi:predicted RNA-binding Zn-ribbon protein involved in translation (DUF1610 family)
MNTATNIIASENCRSCGLALKNHAATYCPGCGALTALGIRSRNVLNGSICLYGTSLIGYGWLAQADEVGSPVIGKGEPQEGLSATEAIWAARYELKKAGVNGDVWVHDAGGERRALLIAGVAAPLYGSLSWEPAIAFAVEASEIVAESAPDSHLESSFDETFEADYAGGDYEQ